MILLGSNIYVFFIVDERILLEFVRQILMIFFKIDLRFLVKIYHCRKENRSLNLYPREMKVFKTWFLESFLNLNLVWFQFSFHSFVYISVLWSISHFLSYLFWSKCRDRLMGVSSFILTICIFFLSLYCLFILSMIERRCQL